MEIVDLNAEDNDWRAERERERKSLSSVSLLFFANNKFHFANENSKAIVQ